MWRVICLALAGLLTACQFEFSSDDEDRERLVFDFATGLEGWETGFADYPVGREADFRLIGGWERLPPPLAPRGAIVLSGANRSDDLFMFARRRVTGLRPDTRYTLTFEVVLATNAPADCVGIGGPPGEAVTVKAGASLVEPLPVVHVEPGAHMYRMNIDKGNQSLGGSDAVVLGDFAGGGGSCIDPEYALKRVDNDSAPLVRFTDRSGVLWLFVGTDSGFEGTTTVYFDEVRVLLEAW